MDSDVRVTVVYRHPLFFSFSHPVLESPEVTLVQRKSTKTGWSRNVGGELHCITHNTYVFMLSVFSMLKI